MKKLPFNYQPSSSDLIRHIEGLIKRGDASARGPYELVNDVMNDAWNEWPKLLEAGNQMAEDVRKGIQVWWKDADRIEKHAGVITPCGDMRQSSYEVECLLANGTRIKGICHKGRGREITNVECISS